MRRSATNALILLLGLLSVSGVAAAQATATNKVTVHIPTVLRLNVDATRARDHKSVDFSWTAKDQLLTPNTVDVQIFANAHWTLTVQELGAGPNLEYLHPGDTSGWRDPMLGDGVVTTQGPTGGWLDYQLDFRVRPGEVATTPDGTRTVVFTLTRP